MSQSSVRPSSVSEQVQELSEAGFPVRQGTRIAARDPKDPDQLAQFSSDLWFSRWAHNIFENYTLVSKCFGIRFLAESCHGLPAFVVGVGPTLDDQIKELKKAKNRAVIISTDAALRALLAHDLVPDLVVNMDCKRDQNRLWESVPRGTLVSVPALLNSCAHAETIRSWPGPILFYNQYHTQDELCKRILPDVLPLLGQIPSAGTVGNMAVLAAHAMGCDPIFAVGMDFCYKPKGPGWQYRAQDWRWQELHEAGVPAGWEPTEIKELYDNDERVHRSFSVKDDTGQEFRTDPELKFYLDSFKELMPHFKVPLVNCSPGGMIPRSFPALSLDQAIDAYCKADLQGGRTVLKYLAGIVPEPRTLS